MGSLKDCTNDAVRWIINRCDWPITNIIIPTA